MDNVLRKKHSGLLVTVSGSMMMMCEITGQPGDTSRHFQTVAVKFKSRKIAFSAVNVSYRCQFKEWGLAFTVAILHLVILEKIHNVTGRESNFYTHRSRK